MSPHSWAAPTGTHFRQGWAMGVWQPSWHRQKAQSPPSSAGFSKKPDPSLSSSYLTVSKAGFPSSEAG